MKNETSILLVNTSDAGGGAEKVACNLHRMFRERGFASSLAVGFRRTNDPSIIVMDSQRLRSRWTKMWVRIADTLQPFLKRLPGGRRVHYTLAFHIGQPGRSLRIHFGQEDFCFPATRELTKLPPVRPKIMNCHNLHGGYFDLGALPWLSNRVPTVLTLHDAWMLSGHCAHSFACDRWKSGCGFCPDLSIYPAIRRDASAYNWQKKRRIYQNSRLFVSTPCHWLMNRVNDSILSPGIIESRVIPYGVDLTLFHPAVKEVVRPILGIPRQAGVVLFTANSIRKNIWKDYQTMHSSMERVSEKMASSQIIFLALGEEGPSERIGRLEVRFIPYQKDPTSVARYYQAADVYVHAAKADTFPNTVLEALACGTPVVATAVGGIPEQVRHGETGFLVDSGDVEGMADGIEKILKDKGLRDRLSEAASEDAIKRFDLNRQADQYLDWYEQILASRARPAENVDLEESPPE
jgi:glycosyltransferase involved in cell wall biosynthesis